MVATGVPQVGLGWAPEPLLRSPFFIGDPWAPGALDVVARDQAGPADVLVVGSGLTMVDVALSLSGRNCRPDRVLHAVSRHGRLPGDARGHAQARRDPRHLDVGRRPSPRSRSRWCVTSRASPGRRGTGAPRSTACGSRPRRCGTASARRTASTFLRDRGRGVERRAAPDGAVERDVPPRARGHRPADAGLGRGDGRAPAAPRRVDGHAQRRDRARRRLGGQLHRPALRRPRRRQRVARRPAAARGPASPWPRSPRQAWASAPSRDGCVDSAGRTDAPVWTLGALRRGELWESTAVPEIRSQASALATSVLDAVAPAAAAAGGRSRRERSPPGGASSRPARPAAVDDRRGGRGATTPGSSA